MKRVCFCLSRSLGIYGVLLFRVWSLLWHVCKLLVASIKSRGLVLLALATARVQGMSRSLANFHEIEAEFNLDGKPRWCSLARQ